MRLMYGLVLILILVGCQSTTQDANYNQYLDTKIEELYGNRLDNYLIFGVVYNSKSANTEVQIIDLERKQLNYLQFTQDSHDISEIKALGNDQIIRYTDCNRMVGKLNISPQTAIELAIKDESTLSGKDLLVAYIPHVLDRCTNEWMVTTKDYIAFLNAETGEIRK
ncbi:hypothetical protein ACP8Y2_22030 [Herpetosiphon llansteffanensis]